jgi:hypothetical protein
MTWILPKRPEPEVVPHQRAVDVAQRGVRARAEAIDLSAVLDRIEDMLERDMPPATIRSFIRAARRDVTL